MTAVMTEEAAAVVEIEEAVAVARGGGGQVEEVADRWWWTEVAVAEDTGSRWRMKKISLTIKTEIDKLRN